MRRDLSLVRKLEKIEKEMGYCEIKIEKGQRLRTQHQFLKLHRDSLESTIQGFEGTASLEEGDGNRLAGRRFLEVYHDVSLEPTSTLSLRLREEFRNLGALPLFLEERDIVNRELEDIEAKIEAFEAFERKKKGLLSERAETLNNFNMNEADPIHHISAEFEQIEQTWNTLTEDLMNMDEAIFYVSRAVDYLKSARGFVLTSRSQFPIDEWLRDGYLVDLFKHSTVGRAKEMVEGADRNLKLALMELICLDEVAIDPEDFEHLLLPFLDTLFDDLFVNGKLSGVLALLEDRGARVEKFLNSLQERRDDILTRQTTQEENREKLFQKIGDARRRLTLATQN